MLSICEVGYVQYFKVLQDKIEKVGILNFLICDGKKFYGELLVVILVFQDGSIYECDGGVVVCISFGNVVLDQVVVVIVWCLVLFGCFLENMCISGKDDVWEVIVIFCFICDQGVQVELGVG